jgi:hypothetical protein
MIRLLEVLAGAGEIDQGAAAWARAHARQHGVSLDTALLELDLVHEQALLRALEECTGLPGAGLSQVQLDPSVAPRVAAEWPEVCPVSMQDGVLTVLVVRPLQGAAHQALAQGRTLRQLVVPGHRLELARAAIYGTVPTERARALEDKLSARGREHVRAAAEAIGVAGSFASACGRLLDYAHRWAQFCCIMVVGAERLRVGAVRGAAGRAGGRVPLPPARCAPGAAVRYGGYYFGTLAGTDEDQAWYREWGRAVPRCVLVAPVPVAARQPVVMYADNAAWGMAPRTAAELTLLAARAGQRWARTGRAAATVHLPNATGRPAHAPGGKGPSGNVGHDDGRSPVQHLTPGEYIAIGRLRAAAAARGMSVEALLDVLLAESGADASADASARVVGEVRELFERLAASLDAQLLRGVESAFRDIVPQLGAAAGDRPRCLPAMPGTRRAAEPPGGLLQVDAPGQGVSADSARRVASYAEKRGGAIRRKL